MRKAAIVTIMLINFGAPAAANQQSDVKWVLPEYDGEALVACEQNSETPVCRAQFFPCETAFELPVGAELGTLPPEIRHDLTACFMAQYRSYQDALWRLAPGSDPDPALTRDARMMNNMMYIHHGNAPGDCRSTQYEKTEDWRCAAQVIRKQLLQAEIDAR